MRIKMRCDIIPDIPHNAKSGTILQKDREYAAKTDDLGTVYGICENGETLHVRPGEFTFLEAPAWVLHDWFLAHREAVFG